ncbi:MAG: hypothetical protein GXC73_17890 [Chitinophagaceae bacterium]|nr:hypothetical protein [Chitinophagaceae bacterium]
MKKIITIASVAALPILTNAQGSSGKIDKEIFNICASIFVVGLFMLFILIILKRNLNFKLKSKMIEKAVPSDIVSSIMQTNPKEERNSNIKWFALLTGIGTGFTIIYFTLPLGIHSLAIMSFSIAVAFLGYFLFLRFSEK